jgi:hypothetical protein
MRQKGGLPAPPPRSPSPRIPRCPGGLYRAFIARVRLGPELSRHGGFSPGLLSTPPPQNNAQSSAKNTELPSPTSRPLCPDLTRHSSVRHASVPPPLPLLALTKSSQTRCPWIAESATHKAHESSSQERNQAGDSEAE